MREDAKKDEAPILSPLLSHLYGPGLGRLAAELVEATEGERVVILGSEPSSPTGWAAGQTTEDRGRYDADVTDPLPAIDFLNWVDVSSGKRDLAEGWDVLVGFPPTSAPRNDELDGFLEVLRETAKRSARAVLFMVPGMLASHRPTTRRSLLQHGRVLHLHFSSRSVKGLRGLPISVPPVLTHWEPGDPEVQTCTITADAADGPGYEAELDAEQPWTFAGLDPRRAARIARWAREGGARQLEELAEVMPPGTTENPDGVPVLLPRQITDWGIDLDVEVDERTRGREPAGGLIELQRGDVIGRSLGEPRWTLVSDADVENGLLATRQILVIRPTEIDPRYLLAFLHSDAANDQFAVAAEGATIPRVSVRVLRELLVPVLTVDDAALAHSDPVQGFRDLAQRLSEQYERQYRAAFDQPDATRVSASLREAARDAGMAESLLRQVTDPVQQARHFLPHPLARTLRVLQNHVQADNQPEIYKDLLRFGETAIILLGATGLAYLASESREVEAWQQGFRRGGVSLGHWLRAANVAAEHARRGGEDLGGIARALATNSKLNQTLDAFLQARKDEAHGAGPRSLFEYEQAVAVLREHLDDALGVLSPLARSDWFVVERIDWYSESDTFSLAGRSLKGDHPDFEHWQAWRSEPLETGVVHVRLGDLTLPLGGYCILQPCSTCLHEELYYPDRLTGSILRLRSLDRGHQADMPVESTRPPRPE